MRMHGIAFTLALSLTAFNVSAQSEEVPVAELTGSMSSKIETVSALAGQTIRSEVVSVKVPAESPLVDYVFSDRGGTIHHARMLHERYQRNEAFASMPGVPDERIEQGPIDVVSSWSTPYLPYRLQFNQLVVGASEASQAEATLRIVRATGGSVVGARLAAPEPSQRSIDRAVRSGDAVIISSPASVAGRYRVTEVREGQVATEPALPVASASNVNYEITRTGELKSLFEADPIYTRVSPFGSDNVPTFPLVYVWPDPTHDDSPIFIEKRYELGSHPYELKLAVSVTNISEQSVVIQSGLTVAAWQHQDQVAGSMFSFPTNLQGGNCYTTEGLQHYDYSEFDDLDSYPQRQWPIAGEPDNDARGTRWVGVGTRYFMLAAIDESAKAEGQCLIRTTALPHGTISATLYTGASRTLKSASGSCVPSWLEARFPDRSCESAYKTLGHAPGTARSQILKTYQLQRERLSGEALAQLEAAWSSLKDRQRSIRRFTLFSGPKDSQFLEESGHNLEASLDFGWFTLLAEPMLRLLRWFYEVLGHWALAIIALTVVVKGVLLPLTQKSFVSMQKMQQLRPKLDALKEEYGDRKEDFAKAQMALFKREGVNPLGGCLPMLLQMPIWFALYRTIYSAVDLFNAPLGAWIQDLSAPDPYYVMPVLLGIIFFVQQLFTPTAAGMDPAQAKMMKFGMPLMMSVFMVALPSGLVLYILVNSILTVFQNLYIKRQMA
jgi:YidC/Oxa1 family membrane protein insertase